MIIIRTKHDIPTSYLYYYTEELIDKAEEKGFKVKIVEQQLEEKVLRKIIKKLKPLFIFFNGHGCNAFIGYKQSFWIARNHKSECHPLRDPVAKPILETSNIIVEELLKGKTVQEAVEKSHAKAADYILDLLFSKEPLASASLQALVANDAALDFKGNPLATIV
ncbi:hypothetical protein HZA99_05670 [Candidatus Woesearchaeota archaeon]|nr:hypothetical protein [Candidatus Woesearchaeota archaeon]